MSAEQEAQAAANAVELERWEGCKENIVPLRRGRNAHQLAICAEVEAKELIEEQRKCVPRIRFRFAINPLIFLLNLTHLYV